MTTITTEQQQAITNLLATMTLPAGLGTAENACSIAAINLALSGQLTDDIPACMSPVIGRWVIGVQDAMPADMRNSAEWKRLLPLAAGTGRDHEKARLQLVLQWMWEVALPLIQPMADERGFGAEWRTMLRERTPSAADAAARATAYAADAAYAAAARAAAARATAYAAAARAAADAAYAARAAADAAYAAARATAYAADAAYAAAARATAYAAYAALAADEVWRQLDPCGLLQRLITHPTPEPQP